MKKNIFAVIFLLCAAAGLSIAQEAAQQPSAREIAVKEKAAIDQQIKAVQQRIFDIEARYWAYTIKEAKSPTIAELESYSLNWVGEPAQNQKLIARIKEILKADNITPLSTEEFKQMTAAKEEISNILAPAGKDEALKKLLTKKECVDISARYWAASIIYAKEATLEDIKDFYADKAYNKAVVKQTKKLVKTGDSKALSKEELYKFDACNSKFHAR